MAAPLCGGRRDGALLPQGWPVHGWIEVVEEGTSGKFRFDVAVVDGRDVLFGFEVFQRHAVPEHKAAALDVLWLELLAEDILAHQLRVPVRSNGGAVRCPACEERAALLGGRARDDAQRVAISDAYVVEMQRRTSAWTTILAEVRGRARAAAPAGVKRRCRPWRRVQHPPRRIRRCELAGRGGRAQRLGEGAQRGLSGIRFVDEGADKHHRLLKRRDTPPVAG